jgi:hypothetical protein
VRVVLEGLGDRPDRERPRVDELGCAVLLRGEDGRAVAHLAVRQRRAVLDREHALAADLLRLALDVERRRGEHDARVVRVLVDRVEHEVDPLLRCAVDLVHDAHVGHAQVGLARVVEQLVAGTVRVDDDDVDVGAHERRVVVAAVPEDHVRLLFGLLEDRGIVDPGEDEVAVGQVRLVLLALLDGGVRRLEVVVALEPLHRLRGEVAVRHRMAEHGDALARPAQELGDAARRLALARAGAHRADRDAGLRRGEHRVARREQDVVGARGEHARADVHHVLVGDVRVREDDLVDPVVAHELHEPALRQDRDPVGVLVARELARVDAALDVRDLRRREGDDLDVVAAAVDDVEVVEVPARSPGDHHPGSIHA